MTIPADLVTLYNGATWTSPVKPDHILYIADVEETISYFTRGGLRAIIFKNEGYEPEFFGDNLQDRVYLIDGIASSQSVGDAELVMKEIDAISNDYNLAPSALNGTTYSTIRVRSSENTSSANGKISTYDFVLEVVEKLVAIRSQ